MIRKMMNRLPLLMAVLMGCMMAACDNDVMQSRVLSGKWQGDWGMYYQYEYRGRVYTFNCYDTRIEFFPDYDFATSGYGRQIDYYDVGPYEYQYYYFHWSIRNGIVSLIYPYDPTLNTSISEYRMSNNTFTGYFINGYDRFYLRKWADYYDWTPYNSYYCYGPRDYHFPYYSPATRAEEDSIVIPFDGEPTEGRIIRRGNRITEAISTEP